MVLGRLGLAAVYWVREGAKTIGSPGAELPISRGDGRRNMPFELQGAGVERAMRLCL